MCITELGQKQDFCCTWQFHVAYNHNPILIINFTSGEIMDGNRYLTLVNTPLSEPDSGLYGKLSPALLQHVWKKALRQEPDLLISYRSPLEAKSTSVFNKLTRHKYYLI